MTIIETMECLLMGAILMFLVLRSVGVIRCVIFAFLAGVLGAQAEVNLRIVNQWTNTVHFSYGSVADSDAILAGADVDYGGMPSGDSCSATYWDYGLPSYRYSWP